MNNMDEKNIENEVVYTNLCKHEIGFLCSRCMNKKEMETKYNKVDVKYPKHKLLVTYYFSKMYN